MNRDQTAFSRQFNSLPLHKQPAAILAVLRETDREPVPSVAKRHKVSEQTIYTWRKHFGQMEPADVKRLKALSTENAKLKKLLAERDLEIEVMKEINRKKR